MRASIPYDIGWLAGYRSEPFPPLGQPAFVGWFDGMRFAVLEAIPSTPRFGVPPPQVMQFSILVAIREQMREYHDRKRKAQADQEAPDATVSPSSDLRPGD